MLKHLFHSGLIFAFLLGMLTDTLFADIITLRSGGVVRGQLVNDESGDPAANIRIRTLSGAEVSVVRSEIKSVTRRPLVREEYEVRSKAAADSVDGQWQLAEWCAAHNMREERQTHLRRVLYFEPDHPEARRLLGFKMVDGKWMTQDGIMADKGFVKYKGQYLRPEKLDEVLQKQKETEAERGWYPKIRQWTAWAGNARSNRQPEGTAKLQAIRDPNAIPALQKTFANDHREDARRMYVSILSEINDERSYRALVHQSLYDDSMDIRQATRDALVKLGIEKALPLYLQALQSDNGVVANRAVTALGEITPKEQYSTVVPRLIESLVTVRHEKVPVVDSVVGMAVHHPNIPGGLGQTLQRVAGMVDSGELPYGAQVQVAFPPGFGPRVKMVSVPREYPNYAVLAALKKLSGKNFPLDVQAWRNWWATEAARADNKIAAGNRGKGPEPPEPPAANEP